MNRDNVIPCCALIFGAFALRGMRFEGCLSTRDNQVGEIGYEGAPASLAVSRISGACVDDRMVAGLGC